MPDRPMDETPNLDTVLMRGDHSTSCPAHEDAPRRRPVPECECFLGKAHDELRDLRARLRQAQCVARAARVYSRGSPMSDFRDRLLDERLPGVGCGWDRHSMLRGAREALLLAADEAQEQHDMLKAQCKRDDAETPRVDVGWLRARAEELK